MADTLGRITIPTPPASGALFPFQPLANAAQTDYPFGMTRDWQVISHRFGGSTTLATQRFSLGTGARRFTFRKSAMSETERRQLTDFYNLVQGSYQTFQYHVPTPGGTGLGTGYTAYTVVFDTVPVSIDHLTNMCRVGLTLLEIPTGSGPTYTISVTDTRFPGTTLTTALLGQTQTLIPLIHIKVRDAAVPDLYLSDRRCTIGGQLYLPRVMDIGEEGTDTILSQDISGSSDNVQFILGNADRALSAFVQDTSLKFASIDLCFFHLDSPTATAGTLLQLWKGIVLDWTLDGGPHFPVRCSDGLFPITQNYPRRTVTRQCWKTFDDGLACPYTSAHTGSGDSAPCDYFFNSPHGCLSHGMSLYFGGQPSFPQSVIIKDNGTGFLGFNKNTVTSTSIVSDSIWGHPLPEIWANDGGDPQRAFWANTLVAAVRDESSFEDVLGIVGTGPIGQYEGMSIQTNADGFTYLVAPLADGFPPQGFQVNGLFQLVKYQPTYGLREVTGADPVVPTTDAFSLGQGGSFNPVTGATSNPITGTPNLQHWDIPDPVFSNVLTGQAHDILPFAAGTAFVELRYSKSPGTGIAPTTAESHSMTVPIARGLTGATFAADGTRTLVSGLVNNVWVAVNTYFRALGLDKATGTAQLSTIVLPSIFKGDGSGSAEICDLFVDPIVGTAPSTYVITSTGDALNGNINVSAGTFTYQEVLSLADAVTAGYIVLQATDLYVLTDSGTSAQGQIIQPTPSDAGSFTHPVKISLAAAVTAGYCAASYTSGKERQFQFQGAVAEFKPFRDWLTEILNSCLGYFTFEFGKLKVGLRENASAVTSFGVGNMLYQSLSVTPAPAKFEYLKIDFANVALQYQQDMAEYQDKDFSAYMGRAGAPLTSRMRSAGTSTLSQALRLAVTRTREEIGGILRPDQSNPYIEFDNNLAVQFGTTVLALGTAVGDVVEITHPDLPTYPGPVGGSPLAAHTWKFRIQRWTLRKDWSLVLTTKSVTDSMYNLAVGPKPADVPPVSPPILFYAEPLGEWAPYQVQATSGDPVWPSEYTFAETQTYPVSTSGDKGVPSALIEAKLPVNQFIPNCTPPAVKQGALAQATTGGLLLGGVTYRIQVCAVNSAGTYSPPSDVLVVQCPTGTNTNSFTLSGIQWPKLSGLTGYVVFVSDQDSLICGQATGALTQVTTNPYTYTPTSISFTTAVARQTYGVPNASLATARIKGKRLIHGGPVGLRIDSTTSTHIVGSDAIDAALTDDWSGRKLLVIGRTAENGSVPFASFSCSAFAPSTGTFTVTPNPSSILLPGDVVVVAFLGYDNSSTPTVLTDAGLSNGTNPTPHTGETTNDPNRIGNYVRVLVGKSRGQKAKIVSNTSTSYTLDRPLVIDSTSLWIVEGAAWTNSVDLALANSDPAKTTALSLPLDNFANLPVLIGLVAVDVDGVEAPEENMPVRMLWVDGAQGKRTVTGDTTQLPGDGTILCDTSGVTQPATVTLSSPGMDASTTSCPISDGVHVVDGTYILIGSEPMLVVSGGGTSGAVTLTVERGPSPASHATSATVHVAGSLTVTFLASELVPNQKLIMSKITTDINFVRLNRGGTDAWIGGTTSRLIPDATTVEYQFSA